MQIGALRLLSDHLAGQFQGIVQGGGCPLPEDMGGLPVGSDPDDPAQPPDGPADRIPGVEDRKRMPGVVVPVELEIPVVEQRLPLESLSA